MPERRVLVNPLHWPNSATHWNMELGALSQASSARNLQCNTWDERANKASCCALDTLVHDLQAAGRAGGFQSSREDLICKKESWERDEHDSCWEGASGLWQVASRYIRDGPTRTKPMFDASCATAASRRFLWHSTGWRDFRRA